MKITNTLTVGALLVALAGTSAALAQQGQPVRPNQPAQPNRPATVDRDAERYAEIKLYSFSSLKGTNIHNANGDSIATIEDLVIVDEHGRIDRAVVKTGAILGFGGKTVAVPFNQLAWDRANERFTLSTTNDDLRRLPEFDPETLRLTPGDTRMNRPGQESAGYQRTAVLATDVRGADIRCASDECGSIDDLIVDMRSGRVVFVSIDPDENFLGIADTKRLAPWPAARWISADEAVDLRATRDQITNAPETPSDLKAMSTTQQIAAVYSAYGLEWKSDRPDAARPMDRRDPAQRPVTPERPSNPDRPGN